MTLRAILERATLATSCALSLWSPALAQGTSAPGLSVDPIHAVSPYAAIASFANGDSLLCDGAGIRRLDPSGATLTTYLSFSPSVFASFILIAPDESVAYVGESTNNDIWRVPLAGSGPPSVLVNLVFNFDACFDQGGDLIVSAATCGFDCGNELVRVDTATGGTSVLAKVSGASGPVAMDALGNLYYGTQQGFAPPLGSLEIVLFPSAALQAGPLPLDDADAVLWSSGWNGLSDFALDPATQRLYAAENTFASGANQVWHVQSNKASSRLLYNGPTGSWCSHFDLRAIQAPAQFLPYQPPAGGELLVSVTDFFANTTTRTALKTARPQGALSGPGASGPGAFTWSIEGGAPNGWILGALGPSATYDPVESAVLITGVPPLFTGLNLATAQFLPVFLPLDAQGDLAFASSNPGAFSGNLALQGVLYGPGFQLLGTTTSVLF
jgi:hypothetical protein